MCSAWASTCCTSRRSTRSAAAAARAATTRSTPRPDDVGSPWAIGAAEGGHKAILTELGTLADFQRLVERAAEHGIEIALDIAFQCAPDHPWVTRASGVVPQARRRHHPVRREPAQEVPGHLPVRLRDATTGARCGRRWPACSSTGSSRACASSASTTRTPRPSRSGNGRSPTCARRYPDVIFLSEAFTRPKVMHRLAKVGLQPVLHLLHLAQHQAAS